MSTAFSLQLNQIRLKKTFKTFFKYTFLSNVLAARSYLADQLNLWFLFSHLLCMFIKKRILQ